MRPVNLIPPEDRRGDRAPLRAGALSYVVVGTCAAALVAVLALVLTQNSITDRENEIAELEVSRDAAAQRAEALAPYAEFASLQQQREQTIQSLAQSRFDWERVMRELAIVIPRSVTLDSLEASIAGNAEAAATAGATGATPISAPSLTMSGCGPSHDAVAEFVAALEDIDGVTRVGLHESTRSSGEGASGESGASNGDSATIGTASTCPPRSAKFGLTAVFDAVDLATPGEPAPVAGEAASVTTEANSSGEQVKEARDTASLITGAAR